MITLDIPDLELSAVSLVEEKNEEFEDDDVEVATRSVSTRSISFGPSENAPVAAAPMPKMAASRRASLGHPLWRPLHAEGVREDPELVDFIRSEGERWHFYLVHLAASFSSTGEEPFVRAWLTVDLTRGDGMDGDPAIAWSMRPQRIEEVVKISETLSVGAGLKLLEVGVTANGNQTVSEDRKRLTLTALRELESTPEWELRSTAASAIEGSYRFALVVRAPRGAVIRGQVQLRAEVERKRFGLFRYRDAAPEAPERSFELQAAPIKQS